MNTANPQSPAQPVIPIPKFSFNHDVAGYLNRLGRYITEITRSNSANMSTTSDADKARLTSYLAASDGYIAYMKAAPQLDLPKTGHDIQWPLEPLDLIPSIDNEDLEDMVRLLMVAHAELANSDSSNRSSGITSFDEVRATAMIAKARNFLTVFMTASSPLDLPASSIDPTSPASKASPLLGGP